MPDMPAVEGVNIPKALARTLEIEETKFLILDGRAMAKNLADARERPASTVSGGFALYSVNEDTLTVQSLDPDFLVKAINQNTLIGINPKDGEHALPMLSSLDEATLKALLQLKESKEAWKTIIYKRVGNLDKALKKSQTYPGTHATIANSLVHINSPEFAQLSK